MSELDDHFVRTYKVSSYLLNGKTDYVIETISIGKITYSGNAGGQLSKNIQKPGYSPIGVLSVDHDVSAGYIALSKYSLSGNTVYTTFRNLTNSQITANVKATILYRKI